MSRRGFTGSAPQIDCHIHGQSTDIAQGVDAAGNKDEGAGDQGMMFGYACNETPELMPAPIYYAHAILRSLADARHSGAAPLLGPDAKSQVTLQYVNGKPVGATAVLVSTQHADRASARKRCARSCARTSSTCCPKAGCATRTISTSTRPAAS